MKKFIVAIGELTNGFTFVGPFDDKESATQFAEEHFDGEAQVLDLHTAEEALR